MKTSFIKVPAVFRGSDNPEQAIININKIQVIYSHTDGECGGIIPENAKSIIQIEDVDQPVYTTVPLKDLQD